MTQTTTCAKCGSPLPGDAPEELCPKCLIIAGLMSQIGVEAPPTCDFSPSEVIRAAQAPAVTQAPVIPRLFGGYRIVRPLGKGGMGTVYEAEEQASGRRLALKVLSHSLDSEQARTRFFREGRLAASVNHPNSVYVFGTEEISGLPVITMELAPGGTLHDLVKRDGPLPIAKAVDATLEIIAGLEAAANAGVLHRDVKPSNCFIDGDGAVKVGDFGLSISTLARGEINLTTTASMMGTPAYASPEQLRGEEIDSRSDIYAVGVTLYYLLTAQTPFTADNMVRLVATVLERPAESPRKLRIEIPEELAQVILRCLAKQPSQRFRSYEELRVALLPFTSAAPAPAGIGVRFLAGVIDGILALFISIVSVIALLPRLVLSEQPGKSNPGLYFLFYWLVFIVPLLTFVIPEGLWGATLGKAIMGLRVVGLKRRLPGIPRTLIRAVIVFLTFILGSRITQNLGYVGLISKDTHNSVLGSPSANVPLLVLPYVCVMLLFVTARRRNGLASVQDLLSGTRVVVKPAWQMRSAAALAPEPVATADGAPQIGPYHVLAELGRPDLSGLLVGYDARLFRKVWIRKLPEGTPEVPAAQRTLTRHGRLRWLGGKRAPGENWDAYEALTGRPLITLLGQPQSWKRVRFWLEDLADELEAGLKDHTLPAALGLDRVWITDDGRAKLLDFVAPGIAALVTDGGKREIASPGAASPTAPHDDRDAQLLLKQVAIAALEGRMPIGGNLTGYVPRIPLPLYARSLVTQMGKFPAFDTLTLQLRQVRNMPAEVSAARRLALLAGCVLPSLLISFCMVLFLWNSITKARQMAAADAAQFAELKLCLNELQSLKQNDHDQDMEQAVEIYIAGRFGNLVTHSQLWHVGTYRNTLTPDQRRMAEEIVASRAAPSEKEFNEASERVKPLGISRQESDNAGTRPVTEWSTRLEVLLPVMAATSICSWLTGLPALLAALLFRGGLLLRGLGLTFVTRDGVPARRWRVLWRAMIIWLPAILISTLLPPAPMPDWLCAAILIMTGAVYAGAALFSLRNPQRGVQDWLARTYMVPR